MKIFAAGLFTETNTFSPIPTGIDDFEILHGDEMGLKRLCNIAPFGAWQKKARARKDKLHVGIFAWAYSAGFTATAAYEALRDELLKSLVVEGPVDIILLNLHGAMATPDYDDCEGDLLAHIRQQVSPETIIAAELDLHCHLSAKMLKYADILITYKENPHTDIASRGDELFDLALRAKQGECTPTMAMFDCKMVGAYPTTTSVMRDFIATMMAEERRSDVLSVSFVHGFAYGDVSDAGGKLLVVTDNNLTLAAKCAEDLGRKIFALRHQLNFDSMPMVEALSKALSLHDDRADDQSKPIVVADQSDNAGSGGPSDSTYALSWLLSHEVKNAAIAIFYDPQVVKLAIAAGVGERLLMRLGGKMGVTSGDPLDISVTVNAIKKNYWHQFPQEEGEAVSIHIGDVVAVNCAGIDIVVSSKRCQCYSPCIFEDLSINVSDKRLLVIKSKQHFYRAFITLAAKILYMAAPGAVPPIVKQIDYRQMPTGDKYPWIDNPFIKKEDGLLIEEKHG